MDPLHFKNERIICTLKHEMSPLEHQELLLFCKDELDELSSLSFSVIYKSGEITIKCEKKYENRINDIMDKIKNNLKDLVREDIVVFESEIAPSKTSLEGYANEILVLVSKNVINITGKDSDSVAAAKHALLIKIGRVKPTKRSQRSQSYWSENYVKTNDGTQFSKEESISAANISKGVAKGCLFDINGLSVYVYVGDILNVDVKSIVSAANPRLVAVQGVSRVIAKAAGCDYYVECCESVKKYGSLAKGECRATGAGKLKFNQIFQVVGPAENENKAMISKALLNGLYTSNTEKQSSIAVPSLGSGTSGFKIKECAQQYYCALQEFAKTDPKYLREVHFVDKDQKKVESIRKVFDEEIRVAKSSNIETVLDQSYIKITLGNGVQLYSAKRDVTSIHVDAIVCPTNLRMAGSGGILQSVLSLSDESFKRDYHTKYAANNELTRVSAVYVRGGQLICKYVLFVVTPRWQIDYTRRPQDFVRDIRVTTKNILKVANELDISTLAVPLIGTSDNESSYPTPLDTCCKYMVEAVEEFFTDFKMSSIKEVHLLSLDNAIVSTFNEYMKKMRQIRCDVDVETMPHDKQSVGVSMINREKTPKETRRCQTITSKNKTPTLDDGDKERTTHMLDSAANFPSRSKDPRPIPMLGKRSDFNQKYDNVVPSVDLLTIKSEDLDNEQTVGIQPDSTTTTDNIEAVLDERTEGPHAHKDDMNAFSQDDDIADSDVLGSITTSTPFVVAASGSDMIGSIKATKPDCQSTNASEMLGSITTTTPIVQGATGSDMIDSISTNPIVYSATGSEMLGSITTTQPNVQSTSDSSDEEDDIQLDMFDIIIRCKKRKGGNEYSPLVLKARTTEEALKWRYIFSSNQHHRVTQKLENVCKLNNLRMHSNVAEIECENNKPSVIEESVKKIVTRETIDLRVTDFSIELAECQRVVDVLIRNCPVFTDQTVSLFMESARCYLVSPTHVFEANIEVFQQTRDFLSTTLGSKTSKRK